MYSLSRRKLHSILLHSFMLHSLSLHNNIQTSSIMLLAKRLLPKLVLMLSFTGFVLQVLQVSLQYFAYATTSVVWLVVPDALAWHDVTICIRYSDILDIESLERETGILYKRAPGSTGAAFQDAVENESKMMIKYIFDYTPKASDVIDSCIYRPDDWTISFGDADHCGRLFNVSRFMMQEMMCYAIHSLNSFQLQRTSVTLSTFYKCHVYELLFNQKLASAVIVNAIASPDGTLPWLSREYSSPLAVKSCGEVTHNFLFVTPSSTHMHKLPPPYDTHCVDMVLDEMYECTRRCLLDRLASQGKAPTWSILHEREGQLYPITQVDMRNRSKRDTFTSADRDCNRACAFAPCDVTYTRTSTTPAMRQETILGFALKSPPQPDTLMQFHATMSFIDYFSFVSSCFGTWFGISFLSLDPFRRRKRRKGGDLGKRQVTTRIQSNLTPSAFRLGVNVRSQRNCW